MKWGDTKDLKNSEKKSKIEDEYHVLMSPKYRSKREEIINELSNVIDIDKFCFTDLFNVLLQCKDYDIVNMFTTILKHIVEIRGTIQFYLLFY